MAAGSEQISKKWIEGAGRICCKCGVQITNMAKQVGEVRTRYGSKKHLQREIVCMDCMAARSAALVKETRARLGLPQ